jgi:hypothetical protein
MMHRLSVGAGAVLLLGVAGMWFAGTVAVRYEPAVATEVPTQPFIDAYGVRLATQLTYNDMSFAPGGQLLAIVVSEFASAASHVWLFDTGSGRIRLATEVAKTDNIGITSQEVRWESPTMAAIEQMRVDWNDQSNNRLEVVHATMDASRVEVIPWHGAHDDAFVATYRSPSGRYQAELLRADRSGGSGSRVRDLKTDAIVFADSVYHWSKVMWTSDERHVVFVWGIGHGYHLLATGETDMPGRTVVIAEGGSWDLLGFAVDPHRPRVAFLSDSSIRIYDLRSHRIERQVPVGWYVNGNLAWSETNRIAYSAESCPPNALTRGEPRTSASPRVMQRVCITAALPD